MNVTDTASHISNFGMMVTTTAFYLVLSSAIMIACFRWFKNIINDIITNNKKVISDLLDETRSQNSMLLDISEGLRSSTLIRIKSVASVFFSYSEERVFHLIHQVIKENNIDDKVSTKNKVKSLLTNMHYDRNNRFDYDTYKGKPLSYYTDVKWIDWVLEVVLKEVYSKTMNEDRTRTNIKSVYDRIELDFYSRLN